MAEDPRDWEEATRAVRGGMARTAYGEISEALFLTQSFAYDSAGAADRRFSGDDPGFIYQRFGNPTTQIFEDRLALMEGAGVPCGPINTLDQVFDDPQVRARGLRVDMPHPAGGSVPLVANPIRLSATPVAYHRPPPMLGEHTDAVLADWLGEDGVG